MFYNFTNTPNFSSKFNKSSNLQVILHKNPFSKHWQILRLISRDRAKSYFQLPLFTAILISSIATPSTSRFAFRRKPGRSPGARPPACMSSVGHHYGSSEERGAGIMVTNRRHATDTIDRTEERGEGDGGGTQHTPKEWYRLV